MVVPVAILAAPAPEPNFFPPSFVPASVRAVPRATVTPRPAAPAPSENPNLWPIVYVAGAVGVLAIRTNVRRQVDRRMPRVVGVLRPRIVVPSDLEPSQAAMALAHEAAHLRRRDPQWSFVADLVCIAFWFAPPVWICARQMRAEAEAACDAEALLQTGAAKRAYAELLLSFAGPAPANALGGPARRLSRRILMLEKTPRYLPRLTAGALVATGLFALIPWRAEAQNPATAPKPSTKPQAPKAQTTNAQASKAAIERELRAVKAERAAMRAQLAQMRIELSRVRAEKTAASSQKRASLDSARKLRAEAALVVAQKRMIDKEIKEVAEKSEVDALRAKIAAERVKMGREREANRQGIDGQKAKAFAEKATTDTLRAKITAERVKTDREREPNRQGIDRQKAKEFAEKATTDALRAKIEVERGKLDGERTATERKRQATEEKKALMDRLRESSDLKRRSIEYQVQRQMSSFGIVEAGAIEKTNNTMILSGNVKLDGKPADDIPSAANPGDPIKVWTRDNSTMRLYRLGDKAPYRYRIVRTPEKEVKKGG